MEIRELNWFYDQMCAISEKQAKEIKNGKKN